MHLNTESCSSWASERLKQQTLSAFFSDSVSLGFFFFFLSSQQLLSRGSHTLKPRAFNHAHEVRVCVTMARTNSLECTEPSHARVAARDNGVCVWI